MPCTVQSPPSLLKSTKPSDPMELLLPYTLFWNPLSQYPLLGQEIRMCPNDECGGELQFYEWTNGRRKGLQPRLIHGTHHTVFLVGAIYKCKENNHKVHATDPRLLNKLGSFDSPFSLLHRSGLANELVDSVISLAREGLSITAIARHIKSLRENFSAGLIKNVVQYYKHYVNKEFIEDEIISFRLSDCLKHITTPFPTNDLIARCFIIVFQKYERAYASHMARFKVQRCLRLDHTFKVASNIRYLRSDGKWVTLYDTIFIVLNEEGIVVSWQFTKSTSLEEVKPLLVALKERIELHEHTPLTVYVDNCCHVRRQLKEIFGNDVLVKLDLFHAVQRITRSMSKHHPLFMSCVHDFRMSLRDPVDLGKRRTMHTPDIAVINRNIEQFMSVWSRACGTTGSIITSKVAKQVRLLQAHILHGCLSNIEPGGGTNYNEALHRYLNPHFTHAGRIGLPLAYALLTILLHTYNCRKTSEDSLLDAVSTQLGFYTSETQATFGIIPKDCAANPSPIENPSSIESAEHGDDSPSLSDACIECILQNAMFSAEIIRNLRRIPGSYGTLSSSMIPFMSRVPSLFFRGSKSTDSSSEDNHKRRLSDVLETWNMCQQNIQGDGNCCFSAVAFSLSVNWGVFTDDERTLLASCGLSSSMTIEVMAAQLRKLAVEEWISNSSYYQSFLVDSVQVDQEAPKFLLPGYFHGDLADTMVLSIANAIHATIIVFSSIQYQPVIVVTPHTQKVKIPLMLAFTQFGAGHYDAVVAKMQDTNRKTHICSCGKNDKTQQSHCQEIMKKYTAVIKCKCLQNKSGCSAACKCRNCGNPCGKKEKSFEHPRKRYRHEWQNYTHDNSAKFAETKKEAIETGPFSILEYFVLANIMETGEINGLEMDPPTISAIFKQVEEICSDINPRNEKDIEHFLQLYKKNMTIFSQLCHNQLNVNLS